MDSADAVRPIKNEEKIKFKAGYIIWGTVIDPVTKVESDSKVKWGFLEQWREYQV